MSGVGGRPHPRRREVGGERLAEETLAILDSHTPAPVDPGVAEKIDAIVRRTEEAFKELHFIA